MDTLFSFSMKAKMTSVLVIGPEVVQIWRESNLEKTFLRCGDTFTKYTRATACENNSSKRLGILHTIRTTWQVRDAAIIVKKQVKI